MRPTERKPWNFAHSGSVCGPNLSQRRRFGADSEGFSAGAADGERVRRTRALAGAGGEQGGEDAAGSPGGGGAAPGAGRAAALQRPARQLQQDEMLTLAAIYGDNIGIFGEKDALRSFQIHVHYEIPDGIGVSAEVLQGVDDDTDSQFFHTFSIRHLAPIQG
ncbi:uncharacterized protein LOC133888508 [Phragmites australis]|uniref:uncharacterized protein LOC133888508 n=1 Tax=Phragmites australis TaxID=29695 RepID=UPI002D76B22E|nr:uncharacterized protein LOC133888508 [Phragmites australis]